jgi:EAL domain-containing protein (putative c-di-GMP-specific phosphodiesterase class I)
MIRSPVPEGPDEVAFRRESIFRLLDGEILGEEWLLDHRPPEKALGWLPVYQALCDRVPQACAPSNYCITVNAASWQLAHRHFQPLWRSMARRARERGRKLAIEWLECTASPGEGSPGEGPLFLELLRTEFGVSVVIDDVGSAGLDGIWRMMSIQPDIIKLDGPAFQKAQHDSWQRDLLAGIVATARSRGIPTVAEWIETQQQRDFAVQLGAQYGQGFWFRDLKGKEYPRCDS